MNWGKWIIVSFVLFAMFIGTLVVVCIREDISLVSKNYYQEELAYQDQIDREKNTEALEGKPVLQLLDNAVIIHFNQSQNIDGGELLLFRPSDNRYDKNFVLGVNDGGTQSFDVTNLPRGMYKAKLQWSMEGKEYYFEEIINL